MYDAIQDVRGELTDISSNVSRIKNLADKENLKMSAKFAKEIEQDLDKIRAKIFDFKEEK